MGNKIDSGRRCGFCDDVMNTSSAFCSTSCFETHCDYLLIDISPRWVEKTLRNLSCPKRYYAVKEYAKRHSFDFDLLKKRLKEKFTIDLCME